MLRFAPVLLLLVGCAAERYTEKEMIERDGNTEYLIEDHSDGFTASVFYRRFQLFKSSDNIREAGKSALFAVVHEKADSVGKAIEPIDETRLKANIGRTFWGTTSWSGQVRVFWKKERAND
jgi:hypothetical protein